MDSTEQHKPTLTIAETLALVSDYYNMPEWHITSRRRSKEYILPRHMLFLLAYLFTDNSLPKIGKELGFDHTTVLHGKRRMQHLVETREKEHKDYVILQAKISKAIGKKPQLIKPKMDYWAHDLTGKVMA